MDTLSSKAQEFDWNNVKQGDVVDGNTVLTSVEITAEPDDMNHQTTPSDATATSNIREPVPEPPTHTLREWQPSLTEKWEMADDPISNFSYNTVDNAYVASHFFMPWKTPAHLNSQPVQGDDAAEAIAGTAATFAPYARGAKAIQGLNAAQFSSKFRGTFAARMSPQLRGKLNKAYNSQGLRKPERNSQTITKMIASLVNFFTGDD